MEETQPPTEGPFKPSDEIGPPPVLESFQLRMRPAARPAPQQHSRLEDFSALLANRLILSGLGVVAVLLLTAIVLVAIGQDGDADAVDAPGVAVEHEDEETPRARAGVVGQTLATITFRNGPAASFPALGTIPRGAMVTVVGRSEDDAWLQVRYPPGSDLRGWVDASLLQVEGDTSDLVIAEPGRAPVVPVTAVPTYFYEAPQETPTEEPTNTPRRRATPARPTPTRTPTVEPTEEPTALPTLDEQPTETPQ